MKAIIALTLVLSALSSVALADQWKVTTTFGSVKLFDTKAKAVTYVLLNKSSVKEIQETRLVTLGENLSFKKLKPKKDD